MSQYKSFKLHSIIRNWNTQQLIETLEDNGLGECCYVIRAKQIDGDTFMNLTEGQLMLWKNNLTQLQIKRLWSVIQLAHGRPEEFVRSNEPKQPIIHKNNQNIRARANSIQNKLEQFRLKDEPQELYSNDEAARSEIQSKKPLLESKPDFITKPNPALPKYNKRVPGIQNKELPTPPTLTLNTGFLSMDKSTSSMHTLPTAHPLRNDTAQNEFKATLRPSQKPPTLSKSLQLSSGKSVLPMPPPNFITELNSPDDVQEDKNQSILHQMINKSPILRKISPQNNVFTTNEEVSQEIPGKRQPIKPQITSYFRPLPAPPSDEDPHPYRSKKIPATPIALPLPATPIGVQLPLPPMGTVPDIELDDFDDDFDEGYEYSDIPELFDYKLKPWFKDVNRDAANNLLKGKPNGAFIVRPSKHETYECNFSIIYDNRFYHLAVRQRGSAFSLGSALYNSITEIVDKYIEEALILNGPNNENCYVKLKFVSF